VDSPEPRVKSSAYTVVDGSGTSSPAGALTGSSAGVVAVVVPGGSATTSANAR
jgi:hypothetical protein